MTTTVIYQSERAECGLACIAMILNHHGGQVRLSTLRQRHASSSQGTTLHDLINIASQYQLESNPLSLSVDELNALKTPCILHWEMNHFVVLVSVDKGNITINDPAKGTRIYTIKEFESGFTGIALELIPTIHFVAPMDTNNVTLLTLLKLPTTAKIAFLKVGILSILLLAISLVIPLFFQWIVDVVIPTKDTKALIYLTVAFVAIVVIQLYSMLLRGKVILFLSTQIGFSLSYRTFKHLLSLPLSYFENRYAASIQSRFDAIENIQYLISSKVITAILDGVMASCIFVALFYYQPHLAAIVLLSTTIFTTIKFASYVKTKNLTDKTIDSNARLAAHLLETISAIKTIKLINTETTRQVRWHDKSNDYYSDRLKLGRLSLFVEYMCGLIFTLDNLIITAIGAWFVFAHDDVLTLGMLTAFIAYKVQLTNKVTLFVENIFDLKMLDLYVERICDIYETKSETHEPLKLDEITSIALKQVSFKYNGQLNNTLNNLNFTVYKGEHIAITGPSGSGKTSLTNLLLGLECPSSGNILINDDPVHVAQFQSIRKHMGIVFQQDKLLSGSFTDNISGFVDDPDIASVTRCAKACVIDDVIKQLPMGYNTLVSEAGAKLSGGQIQRLLLARALYNNPQWLILDEATSHLDAETEAQILKNFKELDLSIISITHRSNSIANATRVIELNDNGCIATESKTTFQRQNINNT